RPVRAHQLPSSRSYPRPCASGFSACANSVRIRIQGHSFMTTATQESPVRAQVKQAQAAISVAGLIDLAEGHAFVRTSGYRRGPDDVYVSAAQIRQYGLRQGDLIEGTARPQPNGTARGKFRP